MGTQKQNAAADFIPKNPHHQTVSSTDAVVVGGGSYNGVPQRSKRPLVVGLTLLALVIVAGVTAFLLLGSEKKSASQALTVCKPEILRQASEVLESPVPAELEVVVTEIKKLPNYQKDPNCMYTATVLAINTGDAKAARTSYDLLAQYFDPEAGISRDLGVRAFQPETLKVNVEALEAQAKQVQQNLEASQ